METPACNQPPEFDPNSYAFSIPENAATSTAVGTVSATDPDQNDTVSYVITAGERRREVRHRRERHDHRGGRTESL